MKRKIWLILILLLICSLILNGCSDAKNKTKQNLTDGDSQEMDLNIENDDDAGSYEYASREEIYTVEKNGAKLSLWYDSNTNFFIGTLKNNTETAISGVNIEIIYRNGLNVNKEIYSEIQSGETKEVYLRGSYEKPKNWRAVFILGNSKSNQGSDKEAVITISRGGNDILAAYGGTVPDGGIVINGITYIGREQLYTLRKNGLKFIFYYDDKWDVFIGLIRNYTNEEVSEVYISAEMLGFKDAGYLSNFTIKPDDGRVVAFSALHHDFKLWRPIVTFNGANHNKQDDEDAIIIIEPYDGIPPYSNLDFYEIND